MPHCSGDFAFMSWSAAALAGAGLPRIDYPIPLAAFPEVLKRGGDVLPVQMLGWLQLFTERDLSAWTCLAPAMTAIARQLAGSYRGLRGDLEGPRWRLSLEPVDLSREVVTVQRGAHLVAAIADRGDGWVSVSHYRALDAKAAGYLIGLGGKPEPDGTVCFRPSAFEYAKDCSAGLGNWYAADRGDSHLSYWNHGVGLGEDRIPVEGWIEQRTVTPLPWAELAIELAAQAVLDESSWADPAQMPDIVGYSETSPMQSSETLASYFEIFRRDRAMGALIGLAVGDAVGTTLEFTSRDSRPPLTDMIGGGPFQLERGQWTDDTSMALCLAESLLANDGLDPLDLIRRFLRWRDQGENSCTGKCFDIGGTIGTALSRFERTGDPLAGSSDPNTAGNGSLMRLSPVSIFWAAEPDLAERAAAEQSRTTHAAPAAVDACRVYARLLVRAIAGEPKQELLKPWPDTADLDPAVAAVMAGSWRGKKRGQIQSSGYVVHSLEAALWAVDQAEDFRGAVLAAANLGGDADTVAAITGQLAGALWGCGSIPESWRTDLAWSTKIHDLAAALFAAGSGRDTARRTSGTEQSIGDAGRNSLPAPRFNVVSKPNNWVKQIRASTSQASNADGQRAHYWQQVRAAILPHLPKRLLASKEGNGSSFWIYQPGQRRWSWWFTVYVMKKGYVGWFLRAKENALGVFSALQAHADELRDACGCDLDLSNLTIGAWLKANCEDESDWPRQVEWFLNTFPPFANKVVEILEAENLVPAP